MGMLCACTTSCMHSWTLLSMHVHSKPPGGGAELNFPVLFGQGSTSLKLPDMCPPVAARIFFECTKLKPKDRPTALEIVTWLRES